MFDEYTQRRFDRMVEDVAVTRNKVEAIERFLGSTRAQFEEQESRLVRLERKIFAVWLIGPVLLGLAAFMQSIRSWLTD